MQYVEAASKALSTSVTGAVRGFLKGPPAAYYDPTVHTMRGWQKKFQQIWLKEGFWSAYNNLRMSTVHRTGGTLMGTDHLGNNYFENRDAPYGERLAFLLRTPPRRAHSQSICSGRTRWCEMPTPSGVWAIEDKYDGSMVCAPSSLAPTADADAPVRCPRRPWCDCRPHLRSFGPRSAHSAWTICQARGSQLTLPPDLADPA